MAENSLNQRSLLIFTGWTILVCSASFLFLNIFIYAFFPVRFQIVPGWLEIGLLILSALISRELLFSKHKNLAEFYAEIKDFEKSLYNYKLAIRLKPGNYEIYNLLGNLFADQHDYQKAINNYQTAINLKNDFAEGYRNLARIYLQTLNYSKAAENFDLAYRFQHGVPTNEKNELGVKESKTEEIFLTKHKLIHDREQLEFLIEKKLINDSFRTLIASYQEISEKNAQNDKFLIQPEKDVQLKIKRYFQRNIYLHKVKKFTEETLNPENNFGEIQEDFFNKKTNYTFFDNFLKEDVLAELYNFSLESTIWHDLQKTGGYLGSSLDDGFNNLLLYQIATEIREKLPVIFGESNLIHIWAYKYDSKRQGIPAHADEAKINVNFWLTPDSANLDNHSGGLILYDQKAPENWDFKNFNAKTGEIYQYLQKNQAEKTIIPYRCNRVTIFDSKLFHETDSFTFREGYPHRRINITMLFA